MSRKIWQVNKVDKVLAASLAEKHTLFPMASLIASSRGIDTDEKIRSFFFDELELSSPWDFPDMDKAVKTITAALENFDRIAVFGDYDADGITATALLYSYLSDQGADVMCKIPDRSEGYGLKCADIDYFAEQGVKLIVTVDCGISNIEEAEYAKQLGIKMVVTDHHRVGDMLPDCCAVVDPYRDDCKCSFNSFAGVGVVFKLLCAMEDSDYNFVLDAYSDIVALGTIGDVMPLVDENRFIVRRGVEMINNSERYGINSLREVAGYGKKRMSAGSLAFTLIPRINAAGRMGSPSRALNLLLCEDPAVSEDIAEEIDSANVQRHKIELEILEEIKEKFKTNPSLKYDRVIVVDGENWPNGIIGIVAAKLVELFGKPAIVIARDGDEARGSGRSFEGFSLYDAIKAASDTLDHFGGHTLAAGIGLKCENIDLFRKKINEYAASLGDVSFPVLNIDCRLNPAAIDKDLLDALSTLEPFGAGNPVPVFGLFNMKIDAVQAVSDGKHIRLMLSKGDTKISAMRFGVSPHEFPFKKGDTVDLAVTVEPNEYLGEVRPGVHVKAVKGAGMDDFCVLKGFSLYEKVKRQENLTAEEKIAARPEREFMLDVFRFIKACGGWKYDIETLCYRLGDNGENLCKVAVSLDAMLELKVLVRDENAVICLPVTPVKADLSASSLLNCLL
ncbi:MAG: single-stranded-DNA-specific exonuclease RecJ [Clostridia bacterium]|nr:single-stranded-DNA-specific exonuclease RecJ [Clostridia bacterium]